MNFAHLNVVTAGVDAAQVELGDNLKINLNLQRQEEGQNEITYLVRDHLHLCMCLGVFALLTITCVVLYACISDKYRCWNLCFPRS